MILPLLQIGDSALPIGGYSHSWGLEAAVQRGRVHDAASLEGWVRCWLRETIAPGEGVVVAAVGRAAALGAWCAAVRAGELLEATVTPPTLRYASRALGAQLLALAESWPWATPAVKRLHEVAAGADVPWHHAAVFAALVAAAGAAPREALLVYLHQAALGAVGAGVRAVPVGHTHGQQIVARLHGEIAVLADEYCDRDLDSTGNFCPAHEVLCHAQGRLYTRLFRS